MAGLDIHPERPNAVVLVSSDDPGAPSALASTLARVCFGDDERVVSLDLSSYVEEYSISRLLGSSAGYVGYGDTTPLWPIAQMPWCVLHLQGLEMCHPAVLGMIAQAVKDGRFSMSTGRRIHVSDTIVILSATSVSRPDRSVGFRPHTVDNSELMDDQEVIQSSGLGPEWTSVIDMVVHTGHQNPDSTHTVEEGVTQDFVDRFAEEGVDISWKSEALAWLADNGIHEMPHHQKELLIENALGPHLASIVSDRRKGGAEQTTSYVVTVVDGQLILSAKEKRD